MKEYQILILFSEELERDVKIYVSLPENYHVENKDYPVLYLNDGQILFNDYDDYQGTSWGIMEGYKANPRSTQIILIGIGSNKSRTDELLPFSFELPNSDKTLGGKANDYMDFIVNTLKPIINKKYRTRTSPENTGMLGISVGGVCATYAATKYHNHFAIFGCVSNAYEPVREKMIDLIRNSDLSIVKKMYLDVGTNESDNEIRRKAYIESNQDIYDALKEKIDDKRIKFDIIKGSQHLEEDWAKRLPSIIEFLFSE